jgi:PAS domain S-box-containing protein
MAEIGDEWFGTAFEKMPVSMVIIDTEGRISRANPALCKLLGYTEDELLKVTLLDLTHTDDQAEVLRQLSEAQAGLRPAIDLEKRCIRKDTTIVWVRATAAFLFDSDANPILVGVMQEITERKVAEEALRDSEARLASIVGSAMDAIITIDNGQRIVLFNLAAEKLFRRPATEAIGQLVDRFIPERFRSSHREHVCIFGETGATTRAMGALGTLFGLRADGGEFPIEASISQIEVRGQKLFTVILRDISERKRAEATVTQLAAIVDSSEDAIIGKALDGTILSWNAGAKRIYGYSADEVEGRNISILIPPDRPNEVPDILERLRRGERVEHLETVRMRKDGKQIDVSVTISPVKDAAGRITGSSAIARDVTERKRAEAALRESEAYFRAVAESSIDAMVATDSVGRISAWNPAAQRMFQYTEEEILGQPLTVIMPERYRKAYQEGMHRYQHTGISRYIGGTMELVGQRKDGSEFPLEVSLSSWKTEQGEFYHGIIRDITDRMKLEQELLLRERSLNSFFTTAPAGLAILDDELRFLQINETLAGIRGLPAQKHLGRTVGEAMPRLAPVIEPIMRRVLETGEAALNFELSGETLAQPGLIRHWVASCFPIVGAYGRPESIGIVMVELTEQRRAEQQLKSSHEQLRALAAHLQSVREDERTNIAREIHDELGQALTGLKMDLSRLASGLTDDQPSLVRKATSMSQLLDTMIESVRKISTELRPGVLDHLGLVEAIKWQAKEFQTRTGVRARVTAPEGIALDRDRSSAIFRTFQEMLTNIARHANATRVTISLKKEEGDLILDVKDNGKGITESQIYSPTSLGLLGMRERTLGLVGELRISGTPGKGTGVTLRAPLRHS